MIFDVAITLVRYDARHYKRGSLTVSRYVHTLIRRAMMDFDRSAVIMRIGDTTLQGVHRVSIVSNRNSPAKHPRKYRIRVEWNDRLCRTSVLNGNRSSYMFANRQTVNVTVFPVLKSIVLKTTWPRRTMHRYLVGDSRWRSFEIIPNDFYYGLAYTTPFDSE